MCRLLLVLALIGPILPTPVPLLYFTDFRAEVMGRDLVAVSWSGTGGAWCLSSSIETFCQRFPAGPYRTSMYARWGDTVVLRDAPEDVLASARVIGRIWLPDVR